MRYPESPRGDVVETLHGHQVPDPYRWLEDADSPATAAWVESQREFGERYLSGLTARRWFRDTMRSVLGRPRAGCPRKLGPLWVVTRNDGRQNQDVWFVADSLAELESGGRVLVDPNGWSEDGTSSVAYVSVSDDGRHAIIGRSDAGSDWVRVSAVELATQRRIGGELLTKFSYPRWLPDSESFLIHRYPDTGRGVGSDTRALSPADIVVHRLNGDEEVVWRNPGDPMLFTHAEPSHDGRWLVVEQGWGTERTNAIWTHPLTTTSAGTRWGDRIDVVPERRWAVDVVGTDGGDLLAVTDRDAPLRRLVRIPIAPSAEFSTVIAAGSDPIAQAVVAGDCLLVERLVDVTPQFSRYGLDGSPRGDLAITGGSCVGIFGRPDETVATIAVSSVTSPATTYAVDTTDGQVRQLELSRGQDCVIAPRLHTDRLRARSADGTQVPYWRIAPAGREGAALPTIVYGYGGFTIPVEADYRPGWTAWLLAGGAVVICNLRGGSEFGQAWYDAGRRETKQHVFDDVIAIGEDLLQRGLAEPGHLAVYGRSNGGLLAGAALTQRPDLWACALPQVGVLDVLRFHKFTGGAAWISDYGDPDVAADFEVARTYSPLHNVRPGTAYPPTLVTTGDHDDRVVPLHSHKFTAALQHAQSGEAPIIERIEVATGHGVGKPTAMVADEWADILAFAAEHTGLRPPT